MSDNIAVLGELRNLAYEAMLDGVRLMRNGQVMQDLIVQGAFSHLPPTSENITNMRTALESAEDRLWNDIDSAILGKLNQVPENSLLQMASDIQTVIEVMHGLEPILALHLRGQSGQQVHEILFEALSYFFSMGALTVLRRRSPTVYAVMRAGGVITDNLGMVDWGAFRSLLPRTRDTNNDANGWHDRLVLQTEDDAARISNLLLQPIAIGIHILSQFEKTEAYVEPLDVRYGWEPDPNNNLPDYERIAKRALSVSLSHKTEENGNQVTQSAILGIAAVPADAGGPGLLVNIRGKLAATISERFTLSAGNIIPLSFYIDCCESGKHDFLTPVAGDISGISLTVAPGAPNLIFGDKNSAYLQLAGFGGKLTLDQQGPAVRLDITQGLLRIAAGEGDSFINTLLGDLEISAPFNTSLLWSPDQGVRLSGGSGLSLSISSNQRFGGVQLQGLEIGLESNDNANGLFKLYGGTQLKGSIGPFHTSIEGMGFNLDFAEKAPNGNQGNFGFMHVDGGFRPPRGIGMAINAASIRGGGFLSLNPEQGEYAGVLELAIGKIGIKAIGMLNTDLPDVSSGWSLMLALYLEFPGVPLGLGFELTGLGGMLGYNHRMDTDALRENLRSGVLDHILFPHNPVANAPQIFRSLRLIFPVADDYLLFGLLLQIRHGGKAEIAVLRFGLIVELGDDTSGTRFILIGQAKIRAPSSQAAIVSLNIDLLGEVTERQGDWLIAIDAQLYDSRIATFNITGSWVARLVTGPNPFVLYAAGGFHPQYRTPAQFNFSHVERCGFNMRKGPARITLESYFAVASNAVMKGANLSIVAKKWGFSAEASMGFDVLIVFSPRFFFIAEVRARAAIKRGRSTVAGASLGFELSGPGRWRAKGRVRIKVLFFKKTLKFNKTWGEDPRDPLPIVDAQALLQKELQRDDNWTSNAGSNYRSPVVLRKLDDDTFIITPDSHVSFRQRALPFNLALDKIGEARVQGTNKFTVSNVKIGRSNTSYTQLEEPFALGRYQDLDEDQKLNHPAFEPMQCGIGIQPNIQATQVGISTSKKLQYEDKELFRPQEPGVDLGVHLNFDLTQKQLEVRDGPLLRDEHYQRVEHAVLRQPAGPIRIRERGYMQVQTNTMQATAGATPVQRHLTGSQAGAQVVEAHLAITH